MTKTPLNKGINALADQKERQKFKSALASITHYLETIDREKEGIKEAVAEISQQYSIDKKIIRKLASTMYKHNYASIQEENEHFALLYETVIEGGLSASSDPLDKDDADSDE